MDKWKNRSKGIQCRTCMHFVEKTSDGRPGNQDDDPATENKIGRCRRHAPTMSGFPVVFTEDFCGDHKLNENSI